MYMTDTRAAIYCRISETDKEVDKVDNQALRLLKYAEAKGYTVTETFTDDGISAFSGASRPAWDRLLLAVKRGEVDVILATEQERMGRNVGEWEPIVLALQTAGVSYDTIRGGGPWDMRKADARKYSRNKVVDASGESEVRIERQLARNEDDLAKGLVLATRTPFGFTAEKGRVVGINESEADLIRKAYADLLKTDSVSIYSIAKSWSTEEREWSSNAVRAVLMRDRNAGWLTYKGERLNRDQPAIVEPDVHEALLGLLKDPSRVPKRGPRTGTLLSGILRCTCGGGMTYVSADRIYKCSKRLGGSTVRHQTIQAGVAEGAVFTAVLEYVRAGDLDAKEEAADITAIQARITENTRQMDAAQDLLMDPDIKDKARAKVRVLTLETELAGLTAERDAAYAARAGGSAFEEFKQHMAEVTDLNESIPLGDLYGLYLGGAAWVALGLEKQRAIIRGSFVVTVSSGAGLRGADRVAVSLV